MAFAGFVFIFLPLDGFIERATCVSPAALIDDSLLLHNHRFAGSPESHPAVLPGLSRCGQERNQTE